MQQLFALVLGRPVKMVVQEDNTQAITAVRKGYSPNMRHLARTQRVALGALHEVFFPEEDAEDDDGESSGECALQHCETCRHKGDSFTKALPGPQFAAARRMLGMTLPSSPQAADENTNEGKESAKIRAKTSEEE